MSRQPRKRDNQTQTGPRELKRERAWLAQATPAPFSFPSPGACDHENVLSETILEAEAVSWLTVPDHRIWYRAFGSAPLDPNHSPGSLDKTEAGWPGSQGQIPHGDSFPNPPLAAGRRFAPLLLPERRGPKASGASPQERTYFLYGYPGLNRIKRPEIQ